MAMGVRRFFIERGKALYPIVHTRWIDVDVPFGQELRDIGVYVDTLR